MRNKKEKPQSKEDEVYSTRSKKIKEIEKKVDELILKNQDKLENLSDTKDSSFLSEHQRNRIYYVRKKDERKRKKSSRSLSKKIISQAKENLGEVPSEKDQNQKIEDSENKLADSEKLNKPFLKRKLKFGFKKPKEKKSLDSISSEKDISLKTAEFQKLEDEDDIKPDKSSKYKEDEIKDLKVDEESDESDKKEPFSSIDDSNPPDAESLGIDFSVEHLDRESEQDLQSDEKDIFKASEEDGTDRSSKTLINTKSGLKSFFKLKKSDKKNEDAGEGENKEDGETTPVENIASKNLSEDEAELLDEKIKNTDLQKDKEDKTEKVEAKAVKLAKKHIGEIPAEKTKPARTPSKTSEKLAKLTEKTEDNEKESFFDLSLEEDVSEHEHVFFDETDIEADSSEGWSPKVPEEEKNKIKATPTVKPDMGSSELPKIVSDDIELPQKLLQNTSTKLSEMGFSDEEWEELDFYKLYEPFAYVEILREKDSLEKCYFLVQVELTEEEEEVMDFILNTMCRIKVDPVDLENKNEEFLLQIIDEIIEEYDVQISEESKNKIYYYISKESLGAGKIDPLMRDPNIEDISCDGSGVPIFLYHRKYGSLKSNIKFNSEEELSSFIFKLAQHCGKHISIAEPMLDATMPDGSRVQLTLSTEVTAKGSTFTIRKFREDPFSPPDLIEFNTMSSEMLAYMWIAIEHGVNVLFAGGTASGKTTALNAMSLFIPSESKIVSIEETREINLPHPNWIPGVARSGFGEVVDKKMVGEIDMYDLMKAALRQRPEYILVGEIRGREAYVLFQAMATGHATYSTVHADSAQSLIHRLEGKPINVPRVMLQSLDIVSLHVITRVKNKRARRCKQIIEIIDIDPTTKEILTNVVFRWDPVEDKFVYSGKSYILERVRAEKDLNREEMTNELKNRTKIINWMNNKNIREFREVSQIVSTYADNPKEVLKKMK